MERDHQHTALPPAHRRALSGETQTTCSRVTPPPTHHTPAMPPDAKKIFPAAVLPKSRSSVRPIRNNLDSMRINNTYPQTSQHRQCSTNHYYFFPCLSFFASLSSRRFSRRARSVSFSSFNSAVARVRSVSTVFLEKNLSLEKLYFNSPSASC